MINVTPAHTGKVGDKIKLNGRFLTITKVLTYSYAPSIFTTGTDNVVRQSLDNYYIPAVLFMFKERKRNEGFDAIDPIVKKVPAIN